ncbi:hypothetical protein HPP92_024962 [Vanilla planifolia]|uniref:CRIB domain-containing protein n=1 Tax=Vanilla planifolia TaxID=51239 RepID=A0A835PJ63_VANPL|nr:hypothetical protein HPP92_024962 [Vanilla planifolia]
MVVKEKKERFATLPFSVSCVSQSSISVVERQPKKTHQNAPSFNPNGRGGDSRGQSNSFVRRKTSSRFLQLQRPKVAAGIHGLVKRFKSLSHLFTVYKFAEEEEEEVKMDIGYPTDVQHVAHIGCEGFKNLESMKNLDKATEVFPLSSLSLKQLELAMASQPTSNSNQVGGPY